MAKRLQVLVRAEDHIQGDAGAKVTLVEYGDFQCPDCKGADAVVKRLQTRFGRELRFVYRNFPLMEIHEMAEPAAEAAEFAAVKGKYWEMHDAIFKSQGKLSEAMLVKLAEGLGIDGAEAGAAVEEQRYRGRIERDIEGGEEAGVHGTPTFFINEKQYEGAWEFEELAAAIEAA